MKNKSILLVFSLCLFLTPSYSQTGFPRYYKCLALMSQGDSLYQVKSYKKAAERYIDAYNTEIEKGIELPRVDMLYNAACCYSLSNQKRKSNNCLYKMISVFNYADYERVQQDTDFENIKNKRDWPIILSKIKVNKSELDRRNKNSLDRTISKVKNNEIVFYPLTPFAKQYLTNDTIPFISISYKNFRVYYSANSYAESKLDFIKEELEGSVRRSTTLLNKGNYNRGINIILFNSVEEMKYYTGIKAQGGIAYAEHDVAFFPFHEKRRPQFKHEIFHIISLTQWGNCTSRLLIEGSAVYADNQCFYSNPIYTINSALLQSNQLFKLTDLIDRFDDKAKENDVIAYLQSAGIFKYLYEKYGHEKMNLLWNQGFQSFQSIFKQPLAEFENEWLEYIKNTPIEKKADLTLVLEQGCG